MRITILLIFCSIVACSQAQTLTGKVIDKSNGQALGLASVISPASVTSASNEGIFKLFGVRLGDSIKVSRIGYRTATTTVRSISDTLIVYLEPLSLMLSPVIIGFKRNYKADSLRNRQQFSSAFNYKGTGFKYVFLKPDSIPGYVYQFNRAPNSTAQLVRVDLLSVLAWARRNKTPVSKLQKLLIKEEEETYVDRLFSEEKITTLTKLHGDSLQAFVNQYRPSAQQAKAMSEYEMLQYIRESYDVFIKSYKSENTSLQLQTPKE